MLEGAGNLLLTRACLESLEAPWFDPAFALTAVRIVIFRAPRALGQALRLADEAVAHTIVPASRTASDGC